MKKVLFFSEYTVWVIVVYTGFGKDGKSILLRL